MRMRLMQGLLRLFTLLEVQSATMLVLGGAVLIGGLAWVDAATGSEIAFGVFYLLPIGIVAWLVTYRWGLILAGLSVLLYIFGDLTTRPLESVHPLIVLWNTVARFSFFAVVVWLLAALRAALDREKTLARTDYLTGAANTRAFWEIAAEELARAQRYHHALTLIVFDVDNFKAVNDQLGHPVGDRVLQLVVRTVRGCLRRQDVIARLGGDEFVMLLPETDHAAAVTVSHKVHTQLVAAMQTAGYAVTFSMGVVSCERGDMTIEGLIQHADRLMYLVKHAGKNAIRYDQFLA